MKYPFFIFSEFFDRNNAFDGRTNQSSTTSHQYSLQSKFFAFSHENWKYEVNKTEIIKIYDKENIRMCINKMLSYHRETALQGAL